MSDPTLTDIIAGARADQERKRRNAQARIAGSLYTKIGICRACGGDIVTVPSPTTDITACRSCGALHIVRLYRTKKGGREVAAALNFYW